MDVHNNGWKALLKKTGWDGVRFKKGTDPLTKTMLFPWGYHGESIISPQEGMTGYEKRALILPTGIPFCQ